MKPYVLSIILAAVYFIAGFITLPNYGISWDETLHFYRGQAYMRFFLTGKTTYDTLPQTNLQGSGGDPDKVITPRRSFYQSNLYDGGYFFQNDSGHPPLNGELAAFSNIIFYQKFGILEDLQSHHLFNILASSLLVFVVVYFATQILGLWGGIIAGLSLILYPLFWAESHFNVKDPPEAAFFAATIWSFYQSIKSFNKKWLFLSFLFFALAIGTKFNAFFIPLIFVLYFTFLNKFNLLRMWQQVKVIPKNYLTLLMIGFVLSFGLFIGSWPFLWQNFPDNLFKIFIYYKEIGTNVRYQPENFFIFDFNAFPSLWILFTTPPLILILFLLGIFSIVSNRIKKKPPILLWLLWFIVPLSRVTLPGSTLYGGIRQIMEFLPAMSLLAALGACQLVEYLKPYIKNRLLMLKVLLVLIFIWPFFVIVKLHPNENVYFNFLIGGLKGAKEQRFPSWGNSFGNAYFQGINWINENAEKGSKLSLIQGTSTNAPAIFLRPDIDYRAGNWSGIEREGEYLMELTFNDSNRDFNYAWDYVDNFLNPVYELKVDGVPILKIWKNDLKYTKESKRRSEVEFRGSVEVKATDHQIIMDLGENVLLSRLYLSFDPLVNCLMPKASFIETSLDGLKWVREKDPIPFRQTKQEENISADRIEYFVAGKKARYIKFAFENTKACPLNYKSYKILTLN